MSRRWWPLLLLLTAFPGLAHAPAHLHLDFARAER